MTSIGFGLERIAWLALGWPRIGATILAVALVAAGYGAVHLRFDDDVRNIFASQSPAFTLYQKVTSDFVDPENQTLVLIEGDDFTDPATFQALRDFQFEVQLVDGVASVYSPFALRESPNADGDMPLLINAAVTGLTPELVQRIRAHPILGARLLSADGKTMLFVVTPLQPKAPLSVAGQLKTAIDTLVAERFAGTEIVATVTGFSTIRAAVLDILQHDQIVLNLAGASIGLAISLIVFRSLAAAIMVAVPAIVAGIGVIGFMGLTGLPLTVMSNIVPALVMVLGYADGMHLCFAFRRHREAGVSVMEAERLAQREVGGACVLAAITTAVAFLSLTISDIVMVRDFGIVGTGGLLVGTVLLLVAHGVLALAIGRFWNIPTAGPTRNILSRLEAPIAAIARFAVARWRTIGLASIVTFLLLAAMHLSVPPQNSVREHLPASDPANGALGRIDDALGGIFLIQIMVPLGNFTPTSPEGLARVGAVHRAVAGISEVTAPLSVWSLVEWLGGGADAATGQRIDSLIDKLDPDTQARFLAPQGASLISVSTHDLPTVQMQALIDTIERTAHEAGGDDIVTTGFAVLNTRESARTIRNLHVSLLLSVLIDLGLIFIAFRSVGFGLLAFLPNVIPVVATGALLFVLHRGMQYTSVIALTVAFGIAINDTLHFLNRFRLAADVGRRSERVVHTARRVGPVLLGTTMIIVAGISTTVMSGLPSVALFGWLVATALIVALICDLAVLPALMAGAPRHWLRARSPEPI